MGFTPFYNKQAFIIFDSLVIKAGSFKTNKSMRLKYIRPIIYCKGVLTGSERIRANIYSDRTLTKLLYSSNWFDLNYIEDNWIGYIAIDFNNNNINGNITYYLTYEIENYIRDNDDFYIGIAYDTPFGTYNNINYFGGVGLTTNFFGFTQ